MIKANINRETNENYLEFEGNLDTIGGEATFIIAKIYSVCCKENPEVGAAFKSYIQHIIADDSSPVWTYSDIVKSLQKEKLEEAIEKLRSILGL